MEIIQQLTFVALLLTGGGFFYKSAKQIANNIQLGKAEEIKGNSGERFKKMMLIAFGQKKMFKRPLPAILHFLVYAGFLIINIEILEIILDGVLGTHRLFYPYISGVYNHIIGFFEILAVAVLVSCVIFLVRRNILKVKRFWKPEMEGWAKRDGNIILYIEIVLMAALLVMNATDLALQEKGAHHYIATGDFAVSQFIKPVFGSIGVEGLTLIERVAWWGHIIGILLFLNYIPFSKHLHIFLAFPNTYFSNLEEAGKIKNMDNITQEVKMMLDPSAVPAGDAPPADMSFGAKDVTDLSWKKVLEAYSCTECGRCTSSCPANQTGKKLSPRKIMMDVRDRAEELGKAKKKNGKDFHDEKFLLGDYISKEELNACTTCNACVEECPVNIEPLAIITELRRNLVMEAADTPGEWNTMFTSMENNGAPWQFSPADRFNWKEKV